MLSALSQLNSFKKFDRILNLKKKITSGNVDEIFTGGLVDLDVASTDVMLVSLQSHVSVFNRVESDQSFSVTPSLGAQTQCHSAPVMRQTELLRPKRNVTVHHLPSAGPLTRYWQPPSPLRTNSTFDRQHKQRYKGAKQQFRRKCKTRRMCGFASSPPLPDQ